KLPIYWRYVIREASDPLVTAIADYRLAQINSDAAAFGRAVKNLGESGFLDWLTNMSDNGSLFTFHLARQAAYSQFLVDLLNRRIVNLKTLATLDSQPQLAELFIALAIHPDGIEKELIMQALGYQDYHSLNHDPILYNLIARLREWVHQADAN